MTPPPAGSQGRRRVTLGSLGRGQGMHSYMLTVGVVALASILIGLAKLGAWVIDRREQQATQLIRDAAFAARAEAEFLPTPSRLRHLEIQATKRGDLHTAAELADIDYSIALLDQQWMSEGWDSEARNV